MGQLLPTAQSSSNQTFSKVPTYLSRPSKQAMKLKDCLDSNADALGNGVDIELAAAALAAHELIRDIDVFIFDCDGVLWKGDVPIYGAAQTIARLRSLGKLLFFITNNSTKSRKGFLEKFTKLGFAVYPEEILCSSFAAAIYLQQNPLKENEKVFVIGQSGIRDELDLIGIPNIIADEEAARTMALGPGVKVEHDPNVGAVVVGFDPFFNYYKIQYAQLCIHKNANCKFIATNMDCVAHVTDAQEWAEAGAMVGAVAAAVEIAPIVVGKPSNTLINYIIGRHNTKQNRMCMIGDRLDTDVLFGLNNGLRTILTLSGTTTIETLFSPTNKIIPDYYIDSIVDIIDSSRKTSFA